MHDSGYRVRKFVRIGPAYQARFNAQDYSKSLEANGEKSQYRPVHHH